MRKINLLPLIIISVILTVILGRGGAALAMFQSPPPTVTPTPTATPPPPTDTPTITPSPTIGPPRLSTSALCGHVGETVTAEGVNFTPNALVSVTWSGAPLGTTPSPVQADPVGRFSLTFVVPNDYDGPHLVRAADGGRMAQFTFGLGESCQPPTPTETATPRATPTPTWTPTPTATPPAEAPRLRCDPAAAVPDQGLTVYGENFHPGGLFYQLRWDGVVIPWAPNGLTVGDNGKLTLWLAAPSDTYELHTLVADDGQGGLAECYIDLMPRDPTPTWTSTATLTPTPTETWTPGPPPRVTVTPTLEPSPFDFCGEADAVFTRDPLVDTRINAGLVLTNTLTAWPDNRVQVGLWQYYRLRESDTGARFSLPGLAAGQSLTLREQFNVTQYAGPVWFQVRLIDSATGQVSVCTSPWFVLYVYDDEPYPPPLLAPPDDVWLNTRQLTLDWLAAGLPAGAGPVDRYEAHLLDLGSGDLLYQAVGANVTEWAQTLTADYGARQLAWRARAHNAGGWGRWATAFYFGVDTVSPLVDITLAGTPGQDDWWLSPVTARVGGSDPAPGSGLKATYFQVGEGRWAQVIPGGSTVVDREGQFVLRAYGRDWALNRSDLALQPVKIDLHPPYSVAAAFSREATSSGWYTAPLTISLMAKDEISGVAERLARVDGGPWQADAVSVAAEGTHQIEYLARDAAGNETQLFQTTAKLDLTPPAGAIALNGSLCQLCSPATASLSGGDGASGLGHWALALALPPASSGRVGLAAPLRQGDTVLASGSDPARDITLDGRQLPAGPLTLRLAVQDVAGWVTALELPVTNAPAVVGPTPTPWLMATATPWPTTTPGVMPYATITPTPGPTATPTTTLTTPALGHGGGSGGNSGGGGSSGSGGLGAPGQPAGYSVGGTVVPAILPVTGTNEPGLPNCLAVAGVVLFVTGLIAGWRVGGQVLKR